MKERKLFMREMLPKKNYFKCSEVSHLLDVKPQELRYWETEFRQLNPQKTKTGKRIYRRDDLILMAAIKHLLLEKKLTLDAARRVIAESDMQIAPDVVEPVLDTLELASTLLDSNEQSFDEVAHEIYQACGDELLLAQTEEVEPAHVGEMIADALSLNEQKNRAEKNCSNIDYEEALATLIASKNSLNELLSSLERFGEAKFYQEPKK